jgi:hypothetical protein
MRRYLVRNHAATANDQTQKGKTGNDQTYTVNVTMEIRANDEEQAARIAWALLERIEDNDLVDATVQKVEL